MDSMDFMRACVWTETREECDARLEKVLGWVGEWSTPERVFSQDKLDHWATTNGFTTAVDTKQIVALLLAVLPLLQIGELRQRVQDTIYAYR